MTSNAGPTAPKVVFIDNGVIQKRDGKDLKGGPLLRVLDECYGSDQYSIGVSPLFWVELSGTTRQVIERIDKVCEGLVPLDNSKNLNTWFGNSLSTIFKTKDLANDLNQLIADGLKKNINDYLPQLSNLLCTLWNDYQKDGGFHGALMRHLAVDRLAVRLSRKHSKAFQRDYIGIGSRILPMVTKLIEEQPGISPYRLLVLAWEPAYYEKRIKREGASHELKEKRDLLDGDLVSRSALQLAGDFRETLILTSDDPDEFISRRRHLVNICIFMNEQIAGRRAEGADFKHIDLIESTVGFFAADNSCRFVQMLNSKPNCVERLKFKLKRICSTRTC